MIEKYEKLKCEAEEKVSKITMENKENIYGMTSVVVVKIRYNKKKPSETSRKQCS